MTKLMIAVLTCIIMLPACVEGEKECLFCGEFNLLNLTKNDFNSERNNDVSVRRTLNIDEFSGHDYYTIWSWCEFKPEQAWSEIMEKEVLIQKNQLKIYSNGTWLWSINTAETYISTTFLGEEIVEEQNNHLEYGSWTYVRANKKFINLKRIGITSSNVMNDVSMYEQFKEPDNIDKSFEIIRDKTKGTLILKSINPNDSKSISGLNSISYSILEGDVFLRLKEKNDKQIVAKMR